jgi:hypothetical protein
VIAGVSLVSSVDRIIEGAPDGTVGGGRYGGAALDAGSEDGRVNAIVVGASEGGRSLKGVETVPSVVGVPAGTGVSCLHNGLSGGRTTIYFLLS